MFRELSAIRAVNNGIDETVRILYTYDTQRIDQRAIVTKEICDINQDNYSISISEADCPLFQYCFLSVIVPNDSSKLYNIVATA